MAYFAPYIDSAGLHIPAYQDIISDLVAQAQTIYGQDLYLGEDSQDYQYLSIVAALQLSHGISPWNTALAQLETVKSELLQLSHGISPWNTFVFDDDSDEVEFRFN